MEPQQVVNKILDDANKEAQRIGTQALEKLNAQQQELQNQLREHEEQTKSLAEKEANTQKQRKLSAARMDIAKQKLAEKRKILEKVFEQARQQFKEMPEQDYIELINRLLLKTVETGDEEVIIDKDESRIDQDFIKEVNRKLGTGYKGNLRLSEKREYLDAGFVLKRGKVKTNLSLKLLLSQASDELEIELAKILFTDSK